MADTSFGAGTPLGVEAPVQRKQPEATARQDAGADVPDYPVDDTERLLSRIPTSVPEGDRPVGPTFEESMEARKKGLASGLLKGGSYAASLGAGLPLTVMASTASGPFAPLVFFGGLGASLYAGHQTEQAARAVLERPETLEGLIVGREGFTAPPSDPRLLSTYKGYETFGASLPMSAGVRFYPSKTITQGFTPVDRALGRFFSGISSAYGELARKRPVIFSAGELMSATGAGFGGYAAEEYFPTGMSSPVEMSPEGVKFLFEVTGGMAPTLGKVFSNAAGSVYDAIKTAVAPGTRSARAEQKAADRLYEMLTDPEMQKTFQTNPQALLAALKEANLISPTQATAAQHTGSLFLTAFESNLARRNVTFGGEAAKIGEDAIRAYKGLIEVLGTSGNPELMAQAAQLEQRFFTDMMNNRMAVAKGDIETELAKLTKPERENRRKLSSIYFNAIKSAYDDVKGYEDELYNIAEKASFRTVSKKTGVVANRTVVPTNLMVKLLDELTKRPDFTQDALGKYLGRIMSYGGDAQQQLNNVETYNIGRLTNHYLDTKSIPADKLQELEIAKVPIMDLRQLKKDLQAEARSLRAGVNPNNDRAALFEQLASKIMDDLESSKGTVGGKWREAFTFTRTMNDYFNRAFPARVFQRDAQGGYARDPELLITDAFKTFKDAGDRTALRMDQIQDALSLAEWAKLVGPREAAFQRGRYEAAVRAGDQAVINELAPIAQRADNSARVLGVLDAQRKFFEQDIAKNLVRYEDVANPMDPSLVMRVPRIDPQRLEAYKTANKDMLDRLGLMDDLRNVDAAEQAFKVMMSKESALAVDLMNQSVWSKILKSPESLPMVINRALQGDNPTKDFREMIRMGAQVPGALDGLRSAVYQMAFSNANGYTRQVRQNPQTGAMEDVFSPIFDTEAYRQFLRPTKPGQPSVFRIMEDEGMLSAGERGRVEEMLKRIDYVQTAMRDRGLMDAAINPVNALDELATKLSGAHLMSPLNPQGPGSLITSQAGVRFFKNIFELAPGAQMQKVFETAAKDPKVFAALIEKGYRGNQQRAMNLQQRVIDILTSAGAGPFNTASVGYLSPPPAVEDRETVSLRGTPPQEARSMFSALTKQQRGVTVPARGIPGFPQARVPQAPASPQMAQGPQQQATARQLYQQLFPESPGSISLMPR
jgi:hypothetical protein